MSCHYFLPPTQRHETLRNIFLAELVVWSGESAEFWIPYGKKGSSLSEVRICERPVGSRAELFSVLSPAGEPQVAEGKLSVPQSGGDSAHRETQSGNSLSSYFSVENKHNPCQRWNDTPLQIYSKPTVLEGMFKQKKKQVCQNNARGCEICLRHTAKTLHMWINVIVNCFLWEWITRVVTALPWLQVLNPHILGYLQASDRRWARQLKRPDRV